MRGLFVGVAVMATLLLGAGRGVAESPSVGVYTERPGEDTGFSTDYDTPRKPRRPRASGTAQSRGAAPAAASNEAPEQQDDDSADTARPPVKTTATPPRPFGAGTGISVPPRIPGAATAPATATGQQPPQRQPAATAQQPAPARSQQAAPTPPAQPQTQPSSQRPQQATAAPVRAPQPASQRPAEPVDARKPRPIPLAPQEAAAPRPAAERAVTDMTMTPPLPLRRPTFPELAEKAGATTTAQSVPVAASEAPAVTTPESAPEAKSAATTPDVKSAAAEVAPEPKATPESKGAAIAETSPGASPSSETAPGEPRAPRIAVVTPAQQPAPKPAPEAKAVSDATPISEPVAESPARQTAEAPAVTQPAPADPAPEVAVVQPAPQPAAPAVEDTLLAPASAAAEPIREAALQPSLAPAETIPAPSQPAEAAPAPATVPAEAKSDDLLAASPEPAAPAPRPVTAAALSAPEPAAAPMSPVAMSPASVSPAVISPATIEAPSISAPREDASTTPPQAAAEPAAPSPAPGALGKVAGLSPEETAQAAPPAPEQKEAAPSPAEIPPLPVSVREARAAALAATPSPQAPARDAAPSLDRMIGQMLLVGFRGLTPDEAWPQKLAAQIKAGTVGGVLFMSHNVQSPQQIKALTGFLLQARGDLPVLMAVDQEGGIVQRLSAEKGFQTYPTARKIGMSNDPLTAYGIYARLATELTRNGFNMNLGPVVDLDRNEKSIIRFKERSYGAMPKHVTSFAKAFAMSHQDVGVLTVLKHFPGHGSTATDSHAQLVTSGSEWDLSELEPYRQLVEQRVAKAIMTGHIANPRISEPDVPASLSERAIRQVLRGALGFTGVVVSDDLEMGALRSKYSIEEIAVRALKAGNDMVILANQSAPAPDLPDRVVAAVRKAVETGALSRDELQASYERIVQMKQQLPAIAPAKAVTASKRASVDRPARIGLGR